MRRQPEEYLLIATSPEALLAEPSPHSAGAVEGRDFEQWLRRLAGPSLLRAVGGWVAERVLRTDLSRPGFALLDLGPRGGARAFRQLMVGLAEELDRYCREKFGVALSYLSLGCFDQQATTRPHRDGAPDESLLVLGYEPTAVASRLYLLDYSAAARERGLAPREFLTQRGLACTGCEEILAGDTTEVAGWDNSHYQVLVINNGAAADGRRGMLGVLHQAVVTRDPGQKRQVHSMTLATAGSAAEVLAPAQVEAFIEAAGTCG
jgi:hypothetical protein